MQPGSASAHCPRCGLEVAPGYPLCPRCKAPQPAAESPARRKVNPVAAGGTSLSPERPIGLYAAIGAGVAAVIVILVLALGGDEESDRETANVEPETAADVTDEIEAQPAAAPAAAALPEASASSADPRRAAAQQLQNLLSARRLWSTVTAQDAAVVVRSGACEDEGMRPAIAESASRLRDAGFSALQCIAKHGGLVFEVGL